MPQQIIEILTRYASTYHAKTGKGKDAYKVSCTAGEKNAAQALLQKWYGGKGLTTLTDTGKSQGEWRIWTADVMRAAPTYESKTPMPESTNIKIKLSQIVDSEITTLQMREEIDHGHVDELKECLDELPPITVFADPLTGKYHIGDGWHRFLAHKLTNKKEITAEIRKGGPAEALVHALGANAEHNALRRTNRDKRKAVTKALEAFPEKSLRELGDICRVTHVFVKKVKDQVLTVNTSGSETTPGSTTQPSTQLSFFDRLNESFKPVAKGLEEIFNHTALLDESVPRAEKVETLRGIERHLKDATQRAADTLKKLEEQES